MPVSTRATDQELQQAVDNPEQLVQRRAMADNPEQNDAIPDQHEDKDRSTDSETEEATPDELFLPDLNNTPLSEAIRRGFPWESLGDIIVECPKLDQIFEVRTLLVNPLT